MRKTLRATAALLALSLMLTACNGAHTSLLPSASPDGAGAQRSQSAPMAGFPETFGSLSFIDRGRRSAKAPVTVTLTLRYNHQAELDRFVAELGRSHGRRHTLTPQEFNVRFAPSAEQERAVVRELRNAGFTITHRYPNRTLIDAAAPSDVVERFFHTEMHTVRQGKYGERFVNVRPATVPFSIASIVRDVSLSNLVIARPVVEQGDEITHPYPDPSNIPAVKPAGSPSAEISPLVRPAVTKCSGQLLLNPGFESGNVDWTASSGVITDDSLLSYQGNWEAWLDGYRTPETDTLAQTVSIPAGCTATLTYFLWVNSSDGKTPKDTLTLTVNGTTVQSFSNATKTGGGYKKETVNLSSYAGGNAAIEWTSNQTGTSVTNFFIDSTALKLSVAGSPSPSPTPTATPTPAPTPTPTTGPTPTPTTGPTPTPTPSAGCNGTALGGPLTNAYGTLATGLADPFDFPVQHGCNGAGYTAAIVIDDPVKTSYVTTYLSAAQVTHTGTIVNEAVDGGGSGDDAETDLDVQTIAGLAPAANIIVYDMGSLADQSIEDAYNQILTDGKAAAVNSSFGGCESSDVPFADSSNAIAEQGAAEGVEFSAASGDTGSNECGRSKGVSTPAGGPYFLSVGGVNFTEQTAPLTSVTMGSLIGDSGGGGVSTVFALPSYQNGIAGIIATGRNQPDISLPFDTVAVYTGGLWGGYLGTSWSSPASVALALEADQYHGSKLGWVDSTIYSVFAAHGYGTYFIPCTSGGNGAYSCTSTSYNQAAGIGAPLGWALAQAL